MSTLPTVQAKKKAAAFDEMMFIHILIGYALGATVTIAIVLHSGALRSGPERIEAELWDGANHLKLGDVTCWKTEAYDWMFRCFSNAK